MTRGEQILAYTSVLRFDHWVKNLFFLPGFVFALALSNSALTYNLTIKALLVFLVFGLVASVNYVINEIVDAPFDRFHPTKKFRAIPSNKVSIPVLLGISVMFLVCALLVAYLYISVAVFVILIVFLISGLLYNVRPLRFKDRAVLDVVTESINNPIRFLGGWVVVSGLYPPVTFLWTFWALGAFWMTGKRYGEYELFKNDRETLLKYRTSFAGYSQKFLRNQLIVSAVLFAVGYVSLSLSVLPQLIYTIPGIIVYFAWYAYMVIEHHPMIREPESLIKHPWFMLYNILLACQFYYVFLVK